MMCCPSDVRYGSVGVPPPSGAPQVFRYFHACSSTGLRSTISSNDISIRDNMSIIGPTSRAIRAIWRFCKLPLNDTRDPDAPAIDFRYYIVRTRRFPFHQPSSKIYLRLSVHLLSSFPSHAISFFLTDIDCDLHQWSGPFSCSFLICSISYPSLITLSTAVCLPLFSGVIDFL